MNTHYTPIQNAFFMRSIIWVNYTLFYNFNVMVLIHFIRFSAYAYLCQIEPRHLLYDSHTDAPNPQR